MTKHIAHSLLKRYPLISDQISTAELRIVLRELEDMLYRATDGDIVEFGCYIGTTSLFLRRMLDAYQQSEQRTLHVYDSFEGLPPKQPADYNAAGTDFKAGELAISKRRFLREFYKAGRRIPVIHKAWFDHLGPHDIPTQIAFAFLDGDFYQSITTSLQLVWPRMSQKGILLVHDYKRDTLPGVAHAVDSFIATKPAIRLQYEQHIAILHAP